MKKVKIGGRENVVHALISSSLFQDVVTIKRATIAMGARQPEWAATIKKVQKQLQEAMEALPVVKKYEATQEEIQEAFEALARRSLKKPSTFSEPHW